MDKTVLYTLDNSTDVSGNVSDAEMLNSTVVIPTTSKFPAIPMVSSQMIVTVGIVICSIGACANAFVLAVLIRARRHFGSAVHTLIANQSAMDLFASIFAIASLVMMLTHGYKYNGNEILDGTICVIFEADTKQTYSTLDTRTFTTYSTTYLRDL